MQIVMKKNNHYRKTKKILYRMTALLGDCGSPLRSVRNDVSVNYFLIYII